MKPSRKRRHLPPLERSDSNELALRYVGRFATTARNCGRTCRERCASAAGTASGSPIRGHCGPVRELGYVDDAALRDGEVAVAPGAATASGAWSTSARGRGHRRGARRRGAGHADDEAVAAGTPIRRRRRIGPSPIRSARSQGANRRPSPRWSARGTATGSPARSSHLPPGNDVNIDQVWVNRAYRA